MTAETVVERPVDRYAALSRIEQLVREIQIICDEFDLDPVQWLVGDEDE